MQAVHKGNGEQDTTRASKSLVYESDNLSCLRNTHITPAGSSLIILGCLTLRHHFSFFAFHYLTPKLKITITYVWRSVQISPTYC